MFLLKVLKSLEKQGVQYAVVGGYAVALHGVVRGTVDLDLVLLLDSITYENAEIALKEIGLVPRLPVSAKEVFHFRKEYIENRNLIAWSFYDPIQPSHLVDFVITEDLRGLKTVTKKINGTSVKVVSVPDLIQMKEKSGRDQDLEDVKALKLLWKEK
tara:strand:+ start:3761 stop:4231 length:471 start_codon:yes stop_codon:yes gene_type:complete